MEFDAVSSQTPLPIRQRDCAFRDKHLLIGIIRQCFGLNIQRIGFGQIKALSDLGFGREQAETH